MHRNDARASFRKPRAGETDPGQRIAAAPLLANRAAHIGLNASGAAREANRWAKFREFRILKLAE